MSESFTGALSNLTFLFPHSINLSMEDNHSTPRNPKLYSVPKSYVGLNNLDCRLEPIEGGLELIEDTNNYSLTPNFPFPRALPPAAGEIHERVLKEVQTALGSRFPIQNVQMMDIPHLGCTISGDPLIYIHERVARFDKRFEEFIFFQWRNPGAGIEDLCRETLTHEYGHKVFDAYIMDHLKRDFPTDLNNDVANNENKRKSIAVHEAFAFWFSNQLNGFRVLSNSLAERYSDRADVPLLKSFYVQLIDESEDLGIRGVINDFQRILSDGARKIRDVELPDWTAKALEKWLENLSLSLNLIYNYNDYPVKKITGVPSVSDHEKSPSMYPSELGLYPDVSGLYNWIEKKRK